MFGHYETIIKEQRDGGTLTKGTRTTNASTALSDFAEYVTRGRESLHMEFAQSFSVTTTNLDTGSIVAEAHNE